MNASINEIADIIFAATQRPASPVTLDEIKGILRLALGAPTASDIIKQGVSDYNERHIQHMGRELTSEEWAAAEISGLYRFCDIPERYGSVKHMKPFGDKLCVVTSTGDCLMVSPERSENGSLLITTELSAEQQEMVRKHMEMRQKVHDDMKNKTGIFAAEGPPYAFACCDFKIYGDD